MTTLVKSVINGYNEFMESGDPRVTAWPMMEGPSTTLLLVAAYVLFVKKIGPAWMQDRKPFKLRYAMLIYNFVLVLMNLLLIYRCVRSFSLPSHKWICRQDHNKDPYSLKLAAQGWWFFCLKFIEFGDTIFFVLRKKNNHISTLHVVHHSVVPIAVWAGFRVEPSNYNYFFPLINTMVHVVMYFYYGLAALGPSVQKYLWWKKYLTTLQMIQFVTVFLYILTLVIINCKVSKFIIWLNIFLASLFLLMFYDYFRNTYLKNKALQKQKEFGMKNLKEEEQKKIPVHFNDVKRKSLENKLS